MCTEDVGEASRKAPVVSLADWRQRCPRCRANVVVPIGYGLPSTETLARARSGEIVLGGCSLSAGLPNRACRACGHRWAHPQT